LSGFKTFSSRLLTAEVPTAAALGLILIFLSVGASAQEAVPPAPSPTATPTPESSPTVEVEPSDESAAATEIADESGSAPEPTPTSTAESDSADESAATAEAMPTPIPDTNSNDETGAAPNASPIPQTESENEVPEEPKEQFDLNAYPETAKLKPSEKWNTFKDGFRGLLVWDFFDGRLTIRTHARIQIEGTLARADDKMVQTIGALDNSFDVRRFSLFAQGTIDHHLRYSASFDFGADSGFGEVFVEGREHGLNVFGYRVGQFRVGSFQEPFSFERVMSSYYTGFLERSLPVWAFTPGNNLGYMVFDTTKNKRLSWAVGFFSWGQTNEANSSNSVLSVTARVTWLPVYRDGGRKLLHVGGSFSTRDPNGDTRYRSRPEARFVDFLVDTGSFPASRIKLYGLEFVGVRGPLSFQSELILSDVSGTDFGKVGFWGSYVEVGWFLTGEQKSYDTQLGVFSRVIPKEESRGLFKKRPGGGLELTGRISNVDLNDGGINGGQMVDVSFGVNWYLSATSAVKFNYIHSTVKDHGHANIVLLRYQFRPLPVPGWR
jgi:phosphate-selective porin OprO/OprP